MTISLESNKGVGSAGSGTGMFATEDEREKMYQREDLLVAPSTTALLADNATYIMEYCTAGLHI